MPWSARFPSLYLTIPAFDPLIAEDKSSSLFCCSRQKTLHPTKRRFRFCCVGFGFIVCLSVCFRFSLFGCVFLCSPNRNLFYTRIKDQHRYLGQDQIQTGATSPSRDRRSEANSIYEIIIRLHRRGESLSRHSERGKTQPSNEDRSREKKYFDLRSPTPAPNPSFKTLPSSLSGNSISNSISI